MTRMRLALYLITCVIIGRCTATVEWEAVVAITAAVLFFSGAIDFADDSPFTPTSKTTEQEGLVDERS